MALENISPEERLFKVIQENKDSPRPSMEGRDSPPKNAGGEADKIEKPAAPGGIKHFFAGITGGKSGEALAGGGAFGGLSVKLQNVDPKTVNKALIVVLTALIILVVYYAVNKRYNIEKITGATLEIPTQNFRAQAIEDFKPAQFYIEEVKKRDIFHPPGEKKIAVESAKPTLKEMTKDFSLAGIYNGAYPEAMVEDKAAKKTYFLREGDEVKGIKVKSILKDKVILRYGEEEVEIL